MAAHPAGGCPDCGRPTTAVDLSAFGLESGQFCSHCGRLVWAV